MNQAADKQSRITREQVYSSNVTTPQAAAIAGFPTSSRGNTMMTTSSQPPQGGSRPSPLSMKPSSSNRKFLSSDANRRGEHLWMVTDAGADGIVQMKQFKTADEFLQFCDDCGDEVVLPSRPEPLNDGNDDGNEDDDEGTPSKAAMSPTAKHREVLSGWDEESYIFDEAALFEEEQQATTIGEKGGSPSSPTKRSVSRGGHHGHCHSDSQSSSSSSSSSSSTSSSSSSTTTSSSDDQDNDRKAKQKRKRQKRRQKRKGRRHSHWLDLQYPRHSQELAGILDLFPIEESTLNDILTRRNRNRRVQQLLASGAVLSDDECEDDENDHHFIVNTGEAVVVEGRYVFVTVTAKRSLQSTQGPPPPPVPSATPPPPPPLVTPNEGGSLLNEDNTTTPSPLQSDQAQSPTPPPPPAAATSGGDPFSTDVTVSVIMFSSWLITIHEEPIAGLQTVLKRLQHHYFHRSRKELKKRQRAASKTLGLSGTTMVRASLLGGTVKMKHKGGPLPSTDDIAQQYSGVGIDEESAATAGAGVTKSSSSIPPTAAPPPVVTSKKALLKMKLNNPWLLSMLLDNVVTAYLPDPTMLLTSIDQIDEMVLLLSGDQQDLLRRMAVLRRRVNTQRLALYKKEKLIRQLSSPAMRGTPVAKSRMAQEQLQQTYSHIQNIAERLNAARETLNQSNTNFASRVSLEMAQLSNEMNVKMQMLSQVASVCLPLTIITGAFGMNVTVPFQTDAFPNTIVPFFVIVMLMVVYLLFAFPAIFKSFYKKHEDQKQQRLVFDAEADM